MPVEPPLDVLQRQRALQQRIVAEVDLADRQIVCRSPVGVHSFEELRRQECSHRAYLFSIRSATCFMASRRRRARRSSDCTRSRAWGLPSWSTRPTQMTNEQ